MTIEEEKQKVREIHKQIAKDFGYGYIEDLDLMFIHVNNEPQMIPVEQSLCFPLLPSKQFYYFVQQLKIVMCSHTDIYFPENQEPEEQLE